MSALPDGNALSDRDAFVAIFNLGMAASPVDATVINFAGGRASHSVAGPSPSLTPGVLGESDDFTSIWNFDGAYQYFVVKSGTHCTNTGCNSPGEFEIDGLALLASPVPVPASLPLLLTALGGFGLVARRRRKAA